MIIIYENVGLKLPCSRKYWPIDIVTGLGARSGPRALRIDAPRISFVRTHCLLLVFPFKLRDTYARFKNVLIEEPSGAWMGVILKPRARAACVRPTHKKKRVYFHWDHKPEAYECSDPEMEVTTCHRRCKVCGISIKA